MRAYSAILQHFWLVVVLWALGPLPEISAHTAPVTTVQPGIQRARASVPIKNFALIDQTSQLFEFSRVKGKVVVVGFGYTSCPDVCPLITSAMRQVQERLAPAERNAVFFLTISTDPEIDSPKVLASYAKRYGVDFYNWSFLTGEERALKPVWKNFGVKVERKAKGLIDHTPLTGVIDQGGILKFAYHGTAPQAKTMLQDVRSLLARSPLG